MMQGAILAYAILRDTVLYARGQKRDIEALEERMSKLINHLISIRSERERTDRLLRHSPSMEQSQAYTVMKSELAVIDQKCLKFIGKYKNMTENKLSPAAELDAAAASVMIDELGSLKTKIVTLNSYHLAKLSRDIEKLSKRASEAVDKFVPEKMILKKSEPDREKLDDGHHVLPVFDKYVDEVLSYLFEDEEEGRKIGILGCQGAGKTTVLRKLHDKVLEQELTDNIIHVEFPPETETTDIDRIVERLQQQIMTELSIDHEAASDAAKNAKTISAFLRDKKYMLLMDHVSAIIDLEILGLRESHQHGKVVICSREKTVLRRMTGYEVVIERLEKGEALTLFQSFCGTFSDDRKKGIAERIIECSAGIPWIIRGVAVYLKDKEDEGTWNYVKTILQSKPRSLRLLDLGGFDKVYEMRYEKLETDAKKCVLYGALFPHQHKIYTDYLVECWIAEGFIVEEAHNQKIRISRERGQVILNKLTDDDLLQWYSGKKWIMMSTNFRRVAFELEYPDEERCAVWFPCKDRRPNDSTWTTFKRMSLIGCELELPQCPQPCNLYTLLLELLKQDSRRIPDSFFRHMASLQVLVLNLTEIEALPGSIEVLENLKSLYLNGCLHLSALPSEAANLVKLEFLDISGTSISTLPLEIQWMINMRCLRASLSSQDEEGIIPPGIISSLRNLEELSLDSAFAFGVVVADRLAKELASLEHLNTLCLCFPNVDSLNTFVTHSKALKNKETGWGTHTFKSFRISIGFHETQHPYESDIESSHERWFRFSTSEEFSASCQDLLDQTSAFEVIGHNGLKSFTSCKFDLHPVKVFVVKSCKDLKNIMDGYITSEEQDFFNVSLLHNMEKLHLYDLESLQCIWYGPVPPTTLANLTSITINGCNKLTWILDPALALSLQSLEYLKVENCSQISMIVQESGETSEIVEESRSNSDLLRSLKKMELSNLTELESIFGESSSISWNSLKSITVIECSKLRDLSLSLTNARKLASIQCEKSWWDTNPLTEEVRQRLLPICCFKEARDGDAVRIIDNGHDRIVVGQQLAPAG